ncbi:MAG TPA: hypothetical protein VK447_19370 [Myxococcaceae bacterium]|nr:hypothetical protein [Myxococcaceae bacterium]
MGLILGSAAVALAAGCLVGQDDLVSRGCANDGDCPEAYACVDDGAGGRCLLQYPLRYDAGTVTRPDAGPARYYCSDVKPLLDYYCVDCHGPARQEGGQFRLDYYARPEGPRGAYAMANRIKYRTALAQTMPPPDAGHPSDLERSRISDWVSAGAPFCADGGFDAGTPDAGTSPDGGRDGGTVAPVDGGYYLTQIQPIFDTYCNWCHNPDWTYQLLVGVSSACNGQPRIQPGSASGSLLYLKITDDPAKCGNSMPRGQAPLIQQDPAATTKIRDWINNGATPN